MIDLIRCNLEGWIVLWSRQLHTSYSRMIPRENGLVGALNDPTNSGCACLWARAVSDSTNEGYVSEARAFEEPLPLSTTVASRIPGKRTAHSIPHPYGSMTLNGLFSTSCATVGDSGGHELTHPVYRVCIENKYMLSFASHCIVFNALL